LIDEFLLAQQKEKEHFSVSTVPVFFSSAYFGQIVTGTGSSLTRRPKSQGKFILPSRNAR